MVKKYSEENYKIIQAELKGMNCEDGGWNPGFLWKLKKKLSPRPVDPPTAMENSDGILLTEPKEIQNEALLYYKNLFNDVPMDEEHVELQTAQEKLCKMRLEQCSAQKTDPWSLEELETVLRDLKKGTSRDPTDMQMNYFQMKLLEKT